MIDSDLDYDPVKLKREKDLRVKKAKRKEILSEEEIKFQGRELLMKVVKCLPKYFGNKKFVSFEDGIQKIKVELSLHPSCVVDYVVSAFISKEWKVKHVFKDTLYEESIDYLELVFPEDWINRILGIKKYKIGA